MLRRPIACCAAISLLLTACGPTGGGGDAGVDATGDTAPADASDTGMPDTSPPGDTAGSDADATGDADTGPRRSLEDYPLSTCDGLDPAACSLPWPSNLYLAPHQARTTGYQLRFGAESLPDTVGTNHIDPVPYRRLDGYGLGTPIMTIFPKVDTSGMADRFDIAPSVAEGASIVLLEVQEDGSTERIPYWAEKDAQAQGDPDDQVLFVRPAVLLEENTRYVVAFRDLQTTDGEAIDPSESFRKLRDGEVDADGTLAERRPRFEEVFELLEDAGVARDSLTLAWDFRTASSDGLHGRMLKMRADAIDEVGQQGPALQFDPMEDVERFRKTDDGSGEPVDEHIGLQIEGTFDVPHYMEETDDDRSWIFHLDEQGEVVQNGSRSAKFLMRVPHAALDGEEVGVILYGHGLLGSRDEIRSSVWSRVAQQYNYIFIATDWTGMAAADQQTAIAATSDVTNFQGIADRMHQGILEFLMLGRTAKYRLDDLPVLKDAGVDINTDDVFYAGGSQGGIYGQTFMALSTELTRGFLAVPGNNYSTLLQRSVNFDQFLQAMEITYPSPADRAIGIGAMQLLWTGTDPVSYAGHIEQDPLVEGAPDKDVLLTPSKGDYQVAVVTNEVVARSEVGIPLMEPYDDMQTPWNVPTASYPHDESATILFDFGNPWPMRQNRPPTADGDDPHDNLAQVDRAGELIDSFLRDGEIIDICEMGTCDF